MHAETYTHILSYFQYICKHLDFKFSQKKKTFWESRKFSESFILYFFTHKYIFNRYIILLYFIRFIHNCRRCYIYIIIIRVSLKNENKH